MRRGDESKNSGHESLYMSNRARSMRTLACTNIAIEVRGRLGPSNGPSARDLGFCGCATQRRAPDLAGTFFLSLYPRLLPSRAEPYGRQYSTGVYEKERRGSLGHM